MLGYKSVIEYRMQGDFCWVVFIQENQNPRFSQEEIFPASAKFSDASFSISSNWILEVFLNSAVTFVFFYSGTNISTFIHAASLCEYPGQL